MTEQDRIFAVQRMQDYILRNRSESIALDGLAKAAGYSAFYAARLFRKYTGKTPFEYQRALNLTDAAKQLRDDGRRIVDVAMDSGFDSHDGFTRAFFREFRVAPRVYRKDAPPVRYFTHYPVRDAYLHKQREGEEKMEEKKMPGVVTVQVVQRPLRKVVLLRSKNATDYWSYCEEVGCDWEGYLNSIKERFDSAALLELPKHLVKPGTSKFASGVEVPHDFDKPLEAGYEIIDLPSVEMLYFTSEPYKNEEDYGAAIDLVQTALDGYDPTRYGYRYAFDLAPQFNFGAYAALGAKCAVPVEKL